MRMTQTSSIVDSWGDAAASHSQLLTHMAARKERPSFQAEIIYERTITCSLHQDWRSWCRYLKLANLYSFRLVGPGFGASRKIWVRYSCFEST